MSRPPVTTRRLVAVMAPTVAACAAVGVFAGPSYPFAAALFIAGILCVSSAALLAPAQDPAEAAAEHALWIDRLRIVAQVQRDARHSHPHDCFCACGIPRADLARFRDEIEVIAWQMQQQERGRG